MVTSYLNHLEGLDGILERHVNVENGTRESLTLGSADAATTFNLDELMMCVNRATERAE